MNIIKMFGFIAMAVVVLFVTSTSGTLICDNDNECLDYEVCDENMCTDACDINNDMYALNAHCKATKHTAHWKCPRRYRGNPLTTCVKTCNTDEECETTDACINNFCRPVCRLHQCGPDEFCDASDHTAQCYSIVNCE